MPSLFRSFLCALLLCCAVAGVALAAAPAAKEETVQTQEAMEKAKKLADTLIPKDPANAEAKAHMEQEKKKEQGQAVLPVPESVTPKAAASGKKVIYGDIIIHK